MLARFLTKMSLLIGIGTTIVALPSGAESVPAHWTCGDTVPCIVAHRSWRDPSRAENSLTEMSKTRAQGVHMLEMDLTISRDDTLYLLHDRTVDRTTDGQGAIADMRDVQIDRLHLITGSGKTTTDPIPRLQDVLSWAHATPATDLMLDIKKAPPTRVALMVRAAEMIDRVIVLTFDPATAKAVLAADKNWHVSVLVRSEQDLAAYRTLAGGRAIIAYIPTFAPPALFHAAHAAGLTIATDAIMPAPNGSLDARAEAVGPDIYRRYLAERPVDVFVTNHAERVIQMVSHAVGTRR